VPDVARIQPKKFIMVKVYITGESDSPKTSEVTNVPFLTSGSTLIKFESCISNSSFLLHYLITRNFYSCVGSED
jgi:hypothetical protein